MIRLASSPEPHIARAFSSHIALSKAHNMPDEAHRKIPSPEPSPEPNPQPDSAVTVRRASMLPAQWDLLFIAVTERLQACIHPEPLEPFKPADEHPLGISASMEEIVQECVGSLKRLHAAVPR